VKMEKAERLDTDWLRNIGFLKWTDFFDEEGVD
jgi:hypothetical protein